MFHIHNGDSSAETAKQSQLPGEHFAFREALIEGPTPLVRDDAQWRAIRAGHLSTSYAVEFDQCARDLEVQENKLASSVEHDETVLWFEHDLFCQVNLLYLLDWFSQQDLRDTRLSLVSIDQFPGVTDFRGLGQLNAHQLASLFPGRKKIQLSELELGRSAWRAYCSADPTAVAQLLETDTTALPFLAGALRAHLRRFPSVKNGLSVIEETVLQLVESGSREFSDLFSRFGDALPEYGFGDAQLWLTLRRMSGAPEPLIETSGLNGKFPGAALTAYTSSKVRFGITALGDSALKGAGDVASLNGIDLWLGGVHLNGLKSLWRWDDQLERLVSK